MYKLTNYSSILKYNDNGSVTSIPTDPANTDYQAYLRMGSRRKYTRRG